MTRRTKSTIIVSFSGGPGSGRRRAANQDGGRSVLVLFFVHSKMGESEHKGEMEEEE